MLTTPAFEQLLDKLGLPERGRQLITQARRQAPVREVQSHGSNVITLLASRKMEREIATESRTVEYAAALNHEVEPEVLEYYPQPCTLKLELINNETGEVHAIDHTPDFLVITRKHIVLQEWKTEEKLLHLARKFPWRYRKEGEHWRSPQIEQALAKMGIAYEVHSGAEIPKNRTKNWEILEDYLHVGAPPVSPAIMQRLKQALADHAMLSVGDLLDAPFQFRADDINAAIVEGQVAYDLDTALLSQPHDFILYRDVSLMHFQQTYAACTHAPTYALDFSLNLKPGAQFRYEGQILEVSLLGEREVVFRVVNEERNMTVDKAWLLAAFEQGALTSCDNNATPAVDVYPLVHYSASALEQASTLARHLTMPFDEKTTPFSARTYYRLKAQQALSSSNGGHEILSVAPRHHEKGNRSARLSEAQLVAMEHIRKTVYTTTRAPNGRTAFEQLRTYCRQGNTPCPSYPTFLKHLQSHDNDSSRRTRLGKRMTYQGKSFYYSLDYDTPRHGVRPFESVHIDHTLLDIELKCRRTGLDLGRPWLTLMIDAFSRRIMAIHLGFQQPDRAAVLMTMRAFVKRWNRLPQMVVSDNGKDLVAADVKHFLTSMGVHIRLRPAGQPRVGSVMERIFGTLNTQLIHNLDGNTELTKQVRMLSGSHLPKRLSNWNLENVYTIIAHWAFDYYDQETHPALDVSPRHAFQRAVKETGERPHRAILFNRDFLIATSPCVDRGAERTIDRQRGVKVHNFYYQSPAFDTYALAKKKCAVRYDPYDISHVFVQLPNREWVEAHCMQLMHLPRMNVKQLEAMSAEYLATHSRAAHLRQDSIAVGPFLEFIATIKPDSQTFRQAQLLGETEFLHERLGLLGTSENEARPKVFGLEPLKAMAIEQSSGLASRPKSTRSKAKRESAVRSNPLPDEHLYGDLD